MRSIGKDEGVEASANDRPALLTLALIRRHYLPIGARTLFRLISSGRFPRADVGIGGKLRLWRRQTIEAWIAEQSNGRQTAQSR